MRKFLAVMILLTWGLWFGGMVVLLIFVTRLFQTSHDVGLHAAPVLFRAFAVYQIIIGAIACVMGTLLTILTRRNVHAILSLLLIVTLADAILIRGWTNRMEMLRLGGESTGAEFQRLHGISSAAYMTAAILLLIVGIGWIITFLSPGKVPRIVTAKDFPAATAGRS